MIPHNLNWNGRRKTVRFGDLVVEDKSTEPIRNKRSNAGVVPEAEEEATCLEGVDVNITRPVSTFDIEGELSVSDRTISDSSKERVRNWTNLETHSKVWKSWKASFN